MKRRSATTTLTRADTVLAALRRDILNGHLDPGSRLGFADLGERYGASTGVLREVLPRLVEQGLATTEPQLGFRVITVSPDQLVELTDARVAIETLAVREALTRGDLSWETAVVAAHHALARTPQIDEQGRLNDDWLAVHEEFHRAIVDGCGNRYLADAATRLRSVSEVYRCWTRDAGDRGERDVPDEHREILEAVVARDAVMAAALIERHIRRTTELLLATAPAPSASR